MNSREQILELFSRGKTDSIPAFSGLIHVVSAGIQSEGLSFHEIHHDSGKMARAAASTFKLTGLPSAVVPLDMLVEAETLGAQVDFREKVEFEFPGIKKFLFESGVQCLQALEGSVRNPKSPDLGFPNSRIGLVCEAIAQLKKKIGGEAVIGGMIPGPYTLLLYLVEPAAMFTEMKKQPQVILDALSLLSSFLSHVGRAYRAAGADFITIHDMGGSPGFIGPAKYEQFVFPAEKQLAENLPGPSVLSICGNTNRSMHLLAQTGVDAISVDQTNDLVSSRVALKDTLLFGNIDPVQILWHGEAGQVIETVQRTKGMGVDAVWPGCDLVLQSPVENIRALMA